MSVKFGDWYWIARTITVVSFMVGSILIANIWCRYICPTGGILELLRRISLFKVYKNADCDNCERCLSVCYMGTRPNEMNCTNCGACLNVCHKDAIHFGRPKNEAPKRT